MAHSFTHLGNTELRYHHSVRIEGGSVPRAVVMDQHLIDRYLMNGWITLSQHKAGEFILHQATRAGIWPTGVDWSATRITGQRNFVPFGAFPLGKTINRIKERFGEFHSRLILRVVCYDEDVSADKRLMGYLGEGLDLISDRGGLRSVPLERLRAATREKGGAERQHPRSGGE